jgi:DNA (cytosine-5)-methyltransferase 1
MSAYYNEFDPFAAAWLRELIKAGHIAPGDVDDRSIKDVKADDLRGYTQCHFFAGIGVWSHALRSAGWSDERPVWTGSCPCQPFSAAGKGGGFDDERHLWPDFFRLIAECRPDVVLGEQVASKDGLGWLDLVYADLEGADYAVGAVDTCAAGFGAPHIRQRLYWSALADADDARLEGRLAERQRAGERAVGPGGLAGRLGDADGDRAGRIGGGVCGSVHSVNGQHDADDAGSPSADGGLADAVRDGAEHGPRQGVGAQAAADRGDRGVSGERLWSWEQGALRGLADASMRGRQQQQDASRSDAGVCGAAPDAQEQVQQSGANGAGDFAGLGDRPGPTNGLWRDADWLGCRDGKWRPVEPGTFPLAHGASARVGRLRGYGNAIVAPQAQAFVEAVMSCS